MRVVCHCPVGVDPRTLCKRSAGDNVDVGHLYALVSDMLCVHGSSCVAKSRHTCDAFGAMIY